MAGNLRAILAELIGTFALVFVGAGAVCVDFLTGGRVGLLGASIAHGFMLTAMVTIFGGISGGHFNPAVTIAMLVVRRLDVIRGVFYVAAQFLGAALAAVALKAVLHGQPDIWSVPPFLGSCDLMAGIGYKAATLLEFIATFFLASAYAASGRPRRATPTGPIGIGMTLTACMLAAGPLTGAAMNPARAFGPAVMTGHWTHWYVYWVGPLFGGIAAYWIHENLYTEKKR